MLQINASKCFLNMDGLIPLYQPVVHVIHYKHSQASCKHSVLIILPVLHITYSQMDLQRSMCRLLSACLAKPKNKGTISTSV